MESDGARRIVKVWYNYVVIKDEAGPSSFRGRGNNGGTYNIVKKEKN
jgi:hypothetical protein